MVSACRQSVLAAAASIAILTVAPAKAASTIFAPDAIVEGKSVADWTGGWLTWESAGSSQ